MSIAKNILMVAAENDALPGGKVGGIGDVVRDVPRALADKGCKVHVITPAYHNLARLPGATKADTVSVEFAGEQLDVDVYQVPVPEYTDSLTHWVLDHPAFCPRETGQIYCNDGSDTPFATDANKFTLLCGTVAELVLHDFFGELDVIHLHDWHAAMLLVLRRYHERYAKLKDTRCVYTIHNLAFQGVRPLKGPDSSIQSWFPKMRVDTQVVDPRWPECINLMRAGINLADKVHTVSPTYAQEILQPSNVEKKGYFGGEGLEADLQKANQQGRLVGILNGCEYPAKGSRKRLSRRQLAALLKKQLWQWICMDAHLSSAHFIADKRIEQFPTAKNQLLITSVGRITEQKIRLLQQCLSNGTTALEAILQELRGKGIYVFIGSGDEELEKFLTTISAEYENFIFLRGYSDDVAQALFHAGDLFLMPSSFEPCGISQMLAMRAGQPCLVHRVGGLNDTVKHETNGFTFSGSNLQDQAQQLMNTFEQALNLVSQQPEEWKNMCKAASKARFTWNSSIEQYNTELYS